ncbi:MAG: flagellar filament capping protein FliD [Planctomycetota bacterium]|nr:flagellar filament capping protein FliD [Planctomycetota bacterium]
MTFSIDGLVSGFDTTSVIESLLGFQQNQIDTLNVRKQGILTEQSAVKGIEAQILSLQSSLATLSRTTNSVFNSKVASSSNEDVIAVAASGGANAGTYQLTVNALASAHQIASQGFESASSTIATGTISIGTGNGSQKTITIDASNNNLTSLADAINEQVTDVSAGIVFDQANAQYRLLLTSNKTGTDNTINITNNLDAGTGTVPDFSGPAVQEASNAEVALGTGPGAITAEFSSNEIEGLLEDVTLSLKSAQPGTLITIDVTSDPTVATESIEKFVTDFNSLMTFIEDQTRFVPETEQASPLLGNRSVSNIKNRLLNTVTSSVPNGKSLNRLAQIGIDINLSGKLEIDSGKLQKALRGELEGVDPNDIPSLFGLTADSSNAGIRFLTGGPRTNANGSSVQVNVTQAAERAQINATNALASDALVIDASNNALQVTVNGKASETLTLTAGTYTRVELADHLQSVINSSTELGQNDVIVSVGNDNRLNIISEKYGAASQVSSISGSSSATIGFTGTENASGQDVLGEFIVNGKVEVANGTGRLLLGDPDNENTADLQVEVTLTAADIVAGNEGQLDVFRGITGQLSTLVSDFVSVDNGLLKTLDQDFEARIKLIDDQIVRVQETTESKREDLIREFTALESILSELQNRGDFISSQLNSIRGVSAGGNSNK